LASLPRIPPTCFVNDAAALYETSFTESNSTILVANIEFLEKLPRPTDESILRPVTPIWMQSYRKSSRNHLRKDSLMTPSLGISRFSILHHTQAPIPDRSEHWDWLIEFPTHFLSKNTREMQASPLPDSLAKDFLLAFAITNPPEGWCERSCFLRLPPHRPIYLTYEGVISGNRGVVEQVAQGELAWGAFEDFEIEFRLHRLQWLKQPSPTPGSFLPASLFSPPPTYSLKLEDWTSASEQPTARLPVTSLSADETPRWRLSKTQA
jgi:hypothetical protein